MSAYNFFLLFVSAFFTAFLYIILKYFQIWKTDNLHGLTFNYLTACLLYFFTDFNHNITILHNLPPLIPSALCIGALFISVFFTAAITAQKSGVTITSIAGKMSMVIPICAGIILYGDQVTTQRILGMLLAIVSVVLSSIQNRKSDHASTANDYLVWLLPFLLFIGSGMVDASIKWSQHHHMNGQKNGVYFSMLFASAGFIGLIGVAWKRIQTGNSISLRSIGAGALLGTMNFLSLYFMLMVLDLPGSESSLAFALSNVMVVLISTFFATILFKEKLSSINITGLILAIASIAILTF